MDQISRSSLIEQLEAAKREQRRCMGGVDPDGCITASKQIADIRRLLRDDESLFAHFQAIANQPKPARRKRAA